VFAFTSYVSKFRKGAKEDLARSVRNRANQDEKIEAEKFSADVAFGAQGRVADAIDDRPVMHEQDSVRP
jgi:hypothetical protein